MTRHINAFCLLTLFTLSPYQVFASESSISPVPGSGYRERYVLKNANEKLLDNQGDGFEALYGLRNARAVLNGVYYRGGANNHANKHNRRANTNPIQDHGLKNMCEEGFTQAVYLYDKNFNTAKKVTKCKMANGRENTLKYDQITIFDYNPEDIARLHSMILEHVRNERLGPIYGHCWNGWHASGYVAATTLRQFCEYTAEQAVQYWDLNTDGFNVEPGYEKVRQRIRDFVPNPNLQLTAEEKAVLCPAPGDLNFR